MPGNLETQIREGLHASAALIVPPTMSGEHIRENARRSNTRAWARGYIGRAIYHRLAYTAMFLLLLLGVGMWTIPALANQIENMPGIRALLAFWGNPDITTAEKLGYAQAPHLFARDQGITIAISRVFFDGHQLVVGYVMHTDQPIEDNVKTRIFPSGAQFFINGNPVQLSAAGGQASMNPHVAAGTYTFFTTSTTHPFPRRFLFGIDVTRVGDIGGQWNFNIPVSMTDIQRQIVSYLPNTSETVGGVRLTVQKVTVTPVTTTVQYRVAPANIDLNLGINVSTENGHALTPVFSGPLSPHPEHLQVGPREWIATFSGRPPAGAKMIQVSLERGGTIYPPMEVRLR